MSNLYQKYDPFFFIYFKRTVLTGSMGTLASERTTNRRLRKTRDRRRHQAGQQTYSQDRYHQPSEPMEASRAQSDKNPRAVSTAAVLPVPRPKNQLQATTHHPLMQPGQEAATNQNVSQPLVQATQDQVSNQDKNETKTQSQSKEKKVKKQAFFNFKRK